MISKEKRRVLQLVDQLRGLASLTVCAAADIEQLRDLARGTGAGQTLRGHAHQLVRVRRDTGPGRRCRRTVSQLQGTGQPHQVRTSRHRQLRDRARRSGASKSVASDLHGIL